DVDSGIEIFDMFMNNNQILWSANHDVGMPFSPLYPNINYYYIGHASAGGIYISGAHDDAPNHEMYIRINNGQNRLQPVELFRHEGGPFWRLIPGLPKVNFDIIL